MTDYTKFVTSEHADKPKFNATVALVTQPFQDQKDFLATLPQAFDIDTALGVQQDAVGVRIGISRQVAVPIDQGWFAFNDARHGFNRGFWKGPYAQQYGIQSFDDDTYRRLQYAKVMANYGDGSVQSAEDILATFFESVAVTYLVYSPDQGASGVPSCQSRLVVGFAGALPAVPYMLIVSREYLPLRPAGTLFDVYATSVGGAPLFGFGISNEYVSGFGAGAWGRDPELLADEGLI